MQLQYRAFLKPRDSSLSNISSPLDIIILIPDVEQASNLERTISTGILDPVVLKKFSLDRDNTFITIKINNTKDTEFCNGFLLAISATLKEMLFSNKMEINCIAFHLEGEDSAAAAICLASSGLWNASFSFSSEDELDLFQEMYQQLRDAFVKAKPIIQKTVIKSKEQDQQ